MKESFWTGGIPIIFGVVISTYFYGDRGIFKEIIARMDQAICGEINGDDNWNYISFSFY